MPRFGLAYRCRSATSKTSIRGGAGYYNITTTGALFYAIAQTLQQNYQTFTNSYTAAGPTFSFPQRPPPRASSLRCSAASTSTARSILNWHDPYSLQSDLSLDHDFGHNIGARISYIGCTPGT